MSGLEEVGVPGPDHLREALTNCTDPLAAIEEFQARITVYWLLLFFYEIIMGRPGRANLKCGIAKCESHVP